MKASEIIIDPEFRDLLPFRSPEEEAALEESIQTEGVRDPLVIWKGMGILVDGHGRKAKADKLGIEYKIVEKEFADRDAVMKWMADVQFSRRNAKETRKAYDMGKEVQAEAAKAKETGAKGAIKTATATVAAKHGVSTKTAKRASAFAAAVDDVAKTEGQAKKDAILSGKEKVSRAKIVQTRPVPVKKKKVKNGRMIFDWSKFMSAFGPLTRQTEACQKAYGGLPSQEYKNIRIHMSGALKAAQAWQKRLTASKGA